MVDVSEPAVVEEAGELLDVLARLAHADLASDLAAEFRPEEVIERALHRMVHISDADEAGLVMWHGPVPSVATGPVAAACAAAAVELRADPALAADYGATSLLVCGVPDVNAERGALVLCRTREAKFGRATVLLLPVFANRLAIALAYAEKLDHLRRAIESRQTIGQACGILIERHKLTAEQAFEMLRDASQRNHVRVRDLAARMIETGEEPSEIR
jgi:hypothetical protein